MDKKNEVLKTEPKLQAIYNAKFEFLYINAALLALRKRL
jgi:hypothetical protein